ncbi:MAG: alanine dehydrogenase [Thermodesulfobacteriota bacterium]|nr:alanine dehydrogenase [Thermodesulfobacteriota bacterium]
MEEQTMIVGIPKEIKEDEYRVGIVPSGVKILEEHGHTVLVETGAGHGCRISDEEFVEAGAIVIDDNEEVYGRSDLIMKVKEPQPSEYTLLREGHILYTYLHLAPNPELTQALLERKIVAIAYETIQDNDGFLPLLFPMSEVAGRMAVQVGAHFLEKTQGGRGVLLGGVPGVRRGRVTIIGAGTVGKAAAKIAVGLGAEVYMLDIDQRRLLHMDDIFENRVTTMISHPDNIAHSVTTSHLVVGAVLIPGDRSPILVTKEMIRGMKSGSVMVDVAIDQGGCFETSRPTTHRNPVFEWEQIVHYCVPNMPGAVARTSTFALTNVTLPYAVNIADNGLEAAIRKLPPLSAGINLYRGTVTHEKVAQALGYKSRPVKQLMDIQHSTH